MTVSRRTAVKLGLAAGATPLLTGLPLDVARAWPGAARAATGGGGTVPEREKTRTPAGAHGGDAAHATDKVRRR